MSLHIHVIIETPQHTNMVCFIASVEDPLHVVAQVNSSADKNCQDISNGGEGGNEAKQRRTPCSSEVRALYTFFNRQEKPGLYFPEIISTNSQ